MNQIIRKIKSLSSRKPTKVLFDVGANTGANSIPKRRKYEIYAFEPAPYLALRLKAQTQGYRHYHVIPKAVSNKAGTIKFNVAVLGDGGVSSMLDFNDELEKTWKGRRDLTYSYSVDVPVVTLKEFVEEKGITNIDYLHCDAQGVDLEVLIGLGDKIGIVGGGVIETARNHEVKLYKNQKFVLDDCIHFLLDNGFLVTDLKPNDAFVNEINIYFRKEQPIKFARFKKKIWRVINFIKRTRGL